MQDPAVVPLATTARLTFRNEKGRELARGSIGPAAPADGAPRGKRFRTAVQHANGNGTESPDAPEAAVHLRLRAHSLVLRVEADGMMPVTRRIEPAELVGVEPAFAVFLRPQ
ncbi:MAG TPA: hypothetical protein VFD82_03045 [Planctomycetota bacterium]|nr:hypothetical protein [Planctomycetota bacterium]